MFEGWISFLVFLGACFAAASSGGIFGPDAWYERLDKPKWNPPNWLFPVAWTPLFLMIATSGWLVWRSGAPSEAVTFAIGLYGVHLVLNAGWSAIFFGLKRMDWALAELVLLWLSIAAMIVVFRPLSETAALLLLPYLAWVSFAGVLNFVLWRRNPAPQQA